MNTRYGTWVLLIGLSLVAGFAQESGPGRRPGPAASVPTGNANRRITLDVAVTDKAGTPVAGLEQADFTLLDNKQPQKILSFHAVTAPAAADPVGVILVVDRINTSPEGVTRVRNETEKFLGGDGGKLAFPVSVVSLSGPGTEVQIGPSQDGNALIGDLEKMDFGVRNSADQQPRSLVTLAEFAEHERSMPGRKVVIWTSPGWSLYLHSGGNLMPQDEQRIFNSIVSLSDALRRARITLYNVNPIGAAESPVRAADYGVFFNGVKGPKQARWGNLGLQPLVNESGGRIFEGNNDLAGEIEACITDGTAFYALTFDGLPGDGPSEYHALEVKVDKPKLTVRTRTGYYAQP